METSKDNECFNTIIPDGNCIPHENNSTVNTVLLYYVIICNSINLMNKSTIIESSE